MTSSSLLLLCDRFIDVETTVCNSCFNRLLEDGIALVLAESAEICS
jgi:hypothetical protein